MTFKYLPLSFSFAESTVVHVDPFAPGDFAEKHILKLVEWFSGYCPAIKS